MCKHTLASVTFVLTLLICGCELYPPPPGLGFTLTIHSDWEDSPGQGRLLAKDATRVEVELWRGEILVQKARENLSKGSAQVSFGGLYQGSYLIVAYGVDGESLRIQRAQVGVTLIRDSVSLGLTLHLLPNGDLPGLVTPLELGAATLPQDFTPGKTYFYKLNIPYQTKLWMDGNAGFDLRVQNEDGLVLASPFAITGGNEIAPQDLFLYLNQGGAGVLTDTAVYVDRVDEVGTPVDRRPLRILATLVQQALADFTIGTGGGRYPPEAEASKVALETALVGSQVLLLGSTPVQQSEVSQSQIDLQSAFNTLLGQKLGTSPLLSPTLGQILPGDHDGAYFKIQWQDNSLAEDGYKVYRKTLSAVEFPGTPLTVLSSNSESWSEGNLDLGLERGQTYIYRITAFSSSSPESSPLDISTGPLEPQLAVYTNETTVHPWEQVLNLSLVAGVFKAYTAPEIDYLALVNRGFWPLSITNLEFQGLHSQDFTFLTPTFYSYDFALGDTGLPRTLQGYPQSVVSGDALLVGLQWNPQASGIRQASLVVTSDDPVRTQGLVQLQVESDLGVSVLENVGGTWVPAFRGEGLTSLAGTTLQLLALDRSGSLLSWDQGLWQVVRSDVPLGCDQIVLWGDQVFVGGPTGIFTLNELIWTWVCAFPEGSTLKSLAVWDGGLVALDTQGVIREWTSLWTTLGTVPAGYDRLGSWDGNLYSWAESGSEMKRWEGQWVSTGVLIPPGTRSLTSFGNAVFGLSVY